MAFRNPNWSIALLALNAADSEQTFQVRSGGQTFEHTLPAGAVTTFTWQGFCDPGVGQFQLKPPHACRHSPMATTMPRSS